ncbi:MAG TPA: hypothetical protein VKT17_02410 [Acidobacteriota bacterium]|nr:hypothetical protein [Acidobacteriota bacterium]
MTMAKRYKWPLVIVLALAAIVCFFFFRMYHDDIKALKSFMAAYEHFDKAISDYADRSGLDAPAKGGEALIELQARASLRLSSLIGNDAELMDEAREIADLSRREMEGLKARDAGLKSLDPKLNAAKGREPDKETEILREKRRAAYARFRELCGNR